MATLTGAVQLALFAATGNTTQLTSSGVTIYSVDNQQYEYVSDFSDGGDYLVVNDGVSRVYLNDQLGTSLIAGDDSFISRRQILMAITKFWRAMVIIPFTFQVVLMQCV
jgi:hypothetical protein